MTCYKANVTVAFFYLMIWNHKKLGSNLGQVTEHPEEDFRNLTSFSTDKGRDRILQPFKSYAIFTDSSFITTLNYIRYYTPSAAEGAE